MICCSSCSLLDDQSLSSSGGLCVCVCVCVCVCMCVYVFAVETRRDGSLWADLLLLFLVLLCRAAFPGGPVHRLILRIAYGRMQPMLL